MRLPLALVPLRNGTFRSLWIASVIGWLGTWLQNTGAGWLMTTLAPQPFIVAMVQAAEAGHAQALAHLLTDLVAVLEAGLGAPGRGVGHGASPGSWGPADSWAG